jgi:hypothetical protein
VVGIEPSDLLTLRDEFLSLLPGEEAGRLGGAGGAAVGVLRQGEAPAWTSARGAGGAHPRALPPEELLAFPAAVATLALVPGLKVVPIASSCCGMAGSFGYEAGNQEASRAMAELSLLPAVRAVPEGELVVADGTSCRHQIADLSRAGSAAQRARAGAGSGCCAQITRSSASSRAKLPRTKHQNRRANVLSRS